MQLVIDNIVSKGYLGLADCNQLRTFGFDPISEISESTGVSREELDSQLLLRKITADQVIEAMRRKGLV